MFWARRLEQKENNAKARAFMNFILLLNQTFKKPDLECRAQAASPEGLIGRGVYRRAFPAWRLQ